jgi:uncharacterized protein YkwD
MKRFVWIALPLGLASCTAIDEILPSLPQLPSQADQRSADLPSAQSATTRQMEAQVQQQINQIRQQNGLSELRMHTKLAQVARDYSRRMAEEDFFSHTSPSGDTMVQRVKSAGIFYFLLGENLFTCTNLPQPVAASVQGWMDSPGHRKNILQPEYRETGIGIWRSGNTYYFTQLFLRSI